MSESARDLEDRLRPAFDEEQIATTWLRIGDARAARVRRRRALRFAAVPVFAVGTAVVIVLALRGSSDPPPLSSLDLALAIEPGREVTAAERRAIELDDGSQITLAPQAILQVLTNDGRRFSTKLVRGTVDFTVRPGGPRTWEIETALATVEVVGTAFRVAHADHAITITVAQGVVVVRGERVTGRVQRVTAGHELVVTDAHLAEKTSPGRAEASAKGTPATAYDERSTTIDHDRAPAAGSGGDRSVSTDRAADHNGDRELRRGDRDRSATPDLGGDRDHRRGDRDRFATPRVAGPSGDRELRRGERSATPPVADPGGDRELRPAGGAATDSPAAAKGGAAGEASPGDRHLKPVDRAPRPRVDPAAVPRPSIANALAEADELRPRDPAAAAALIERALASHPNDSSSGVAQFVLGRLYLESIGQPARAAAIFRAIADRGSPSGLAEDARARLVEALVKTGDVAGARQALAEYERRYPRGRWHAALRKLVSVP